MHTLILNPLRRHHIHRAPAVLSHPPPTSQGSTLLLILWRRLHFIKTLVELTHLYLLHPILPDRLLCLSPQRCFTLSLLPHRVKQTLRKAQRASRTHRLPTHPPSSHRRAKRGHKQQHKESPPRLTLQKGMTGLSQLLLLHPEQH